MRCWVAALAAAWMALCAKSSGASLADTTKDVRKQYEEFPYPHYKKGSDFSSVGRPKVSDLPTINERIFHGRLFEKYAGTAPGKRLRVLIAGCGTGGGVVTMAKQLQQWAPDAELVGVDLSSASLAITKQRIQDIRARQLDVFGPDSESSRYIVDHIRLVRVDMNELLLPGANSRKFANLLKTKEPRDHQLILGTFDIVICYGVLHHLADPTQGVRALKSVLRPGGVIAGMVYAPYGRQAVYLAQTIARQVSQAVAGGNLRDPRVVALTRELLDARGGAGVTEGAPLESGLLPHSHPIHNDILLNFVEELKYDEGLVDMLLHEQDRPYSVQELVSDLLAPAGMRLQSFVERHKYDPRQYVGDNPSAEWLKIIDSMNFVQQAVIAEAFSSSIDRHEFYAVANEEGGGVGQLSAQTEEAFPIPRFFCRPEAHAKLVSQMEVIRFEYPIHTRHHKGSFTSGSKAMPPIRGQVVERLDGETTVRQIVEEIHARGVEIEYADGTKLRLSRDDIKAQTEVVLQALQSANQLALSWTALPVNPGWDVEERFLVRRANCGMEFWGSFRTITNWNREWRAPKV